MAFIGRPDRPPRPIAPIMGKTHEVARQADRLRAGCFAIRQFQPVDIIEPLAVAHAGIIMRRGRCGSAEPDHLPGSE